MSITYFATDSHGHTYSRHSASHLEPRYFSAIIYRPDGTTHAVSKANVSYTASKRPYGDGNEVVAVRAYPGRHKVEPTTLPPTIVGGTRETHEEIRQLDKAEAATSASACPTSKAYSELRWAYDHFNAELFGNRLPRCLITLQRKGPRTLGYYSPDRFSGIVNPELKADEIALNPVHFVGRSTIDVLSTLVHEMVHLQHARFGTPPRKGYHDKAWGNLMKAVGLHPSNTSSPGGRETGQQMSHYIIDGGPFYHSCLRLLNTGFTLSFADRFGQGEGKAKSPKAGRRSKYVCFECQLAAWAKPEAKLMCADCGIIMDEE